MDRRVTGNLAAGPKFPLSSRAALGLGTGAGALTRDTKPANSFPSGPPYSLNQKGPGLGEDKRPEGGGEAVATHIGHKHLALPTVQHLLQLLIRHHPGICCEGEKPGSELHRVT